MLTNLGCREDRGRVTLPLRIASRRKLDSTVYSIRFTRRPLDT